MYVHFKHKCILGYIQSLAVESVDMKGCLHMGMDSYNVYSFLSLYGMDTGLCTLEQNQWQYCTRKRNIIITFVSTHTLLLQDSLYLPGTLGCVFSLLNIHKESFSLPGLLFQVFIFTLRSSVSLCGLSVNSLRLGSSL